jgi:hypothetical protein
MSYFIYLGRTEGDLLRNILCDSRIPADPSWSTPDTYQVRRFHPVSRVSRELEAERRDFVEFPCIKIIYLVLPAHGVVQSMLQCSHDSFPMARRRYI